MDADLNSIAPVVFTETPEDAWYSGWSWSQDLEKLFPGQDTYDFSTCVEYHIGREVFDAGIVSLVCKQFGENDGSNWIWEVGLADGRTIQIEGWCDYTGWDCQSGATVTEV